MSHLPGKDRVGETLSTAAAPAHHHWNLFEYNIISNTTMNFQYHHFEFSIPPFEFSIPLFEFPYQIFHHPEYSIYIYFMEEHCCW